MSDQISRSAIEIEAHDRAPWLASRLRALLDIERTAYVDELGQQVAAWLAADPEEFTLVSSLGVEELGGLHDEQDAEFVSSLMDAYQEDRDFVNGSIDEIEDTDKDPFESDCWVWELDEDGSGVGTFVPPAWTQMVTTGHSLRYALGREATVDQFLQAHTGNVVPAFGHPHIEVWGDRLEEEYQYAFGPRLIATLLAQTDDPEVTDFTTWAQRCWQLEADTLMPDSTVIDWVYDDGGSRFSIAVENLLDTDSFLEPWDIVRAMPLTKVMGRWGAASRVAISIARDKKRAQQQAATQGRATATHVVADWMPKFRQAAGQQQKFDRQDLAKVSDAFRLIGLVGIDRRVFVENTLLWSNRLRADLLAIDG